MSADQVFSISLTTRFRHRNVVELFGHLVALGESPLEELDGFLGGRLVGRGLVHQDEGRRRDRPGGFARLVGEDHVVAGSLRPVGVGSSGLERGDGRLHGLAGLVDHRGVGQLVLLGVGIFDIADRVLGLADVAGNAFVALGANAHRPFDRGAGTDLGLPLGARLGEIVGEVEGGARTVGTADHGDGVGRQLQLRIELRDRGIVPLRDLAEIDVAEQFARQHQFTRLDAFEVHDRNDRAHHHRPLHQAVLFELLDLQRRVGGAERHGLGLDLLDAGAGADRLVVQTVAGLLFVGVGPLRIDREREGGARAGDVGGERRRRCGDQACSDDGFDEIHGLVSIW